MQWKEVLTVANKGSFKKGITPWNKGMKGLHFSPATEFKEGQNVGPQHPCWKGGLQQPANDCAYLYDGVNSRRRRPKVIWETFNGSLPDGYIIYHRDGDKDNDELWNLEAITRKELLKRNRKK